MCKFYWSHAHQGTHTLSQLFPTWHVGVARKREDGFVRSRAWPQIGWFRIHNPATSAPQRSPCEQGHSSIPATNGSTRMVKLLSCSATCCTACGRCFGCSQRECTLQTTTTALLKANWIASWKKSRMTPSRFTSKCRTMMSPCWQSIFVCVTKSMQLSKAWGFAMWSTQLSKMIYPKKSKRLPLFFGASGPKTAPVEASARATSPTLLTESFGEEATSEVVSKSSFKTSQDASLGCLGFWCAQKTSRWLQPLFPMPTRLIPACCGASYLTTGVNVIINFELNAWPSCPTPGSQVAINFILCRILCSHWFLSSGVWSWSSLMNSRFGQFVTPTHTRRRYPWLLGIDEKVFARVCLCVGVHGVIFSIYLSKCFARVCLCVGVQDAIFLDLFVKVFCALVFVRWSAQRYFFRFICQSVLRACVCESR